jgi:hypothetical protein
MVQLFFKKLIMLTCVLFPFPKERQVLAVLMYHKIVPEIGIDVTGEVDVLSFESQIKYLLSRSYKFLSWQKTKDMLGSGGFSGKNILLTFDDGSLSVYKHALPVLKKYGLPAVIFLSTGFIETENNYWWDMLEAGLKATPKDYLVFGDEKEENLLPVRTNAQKAAAFRKITTKVKDRKSVV